MSYNKNPDKKKIAGLVASHRKHEKDRHPKTIFTKLRNGDRGALSEAITLLESTRTGHQEMASAIIHECLPFTGRSVRIGITGVPGVGKSTFIESFGLYLAGLGKKIAVLAIDPSSEKSRGSILGDKTRMVNLSVHPSAFIRPTASRGSLGGVAQRTRESILLCEAAGYDVILVETVGVGQSETAVHSMTDFFLLLMLAGAGDELQGIKRGIMEMADAVIITKADGKNVKAAKLAKAQFSSALHLFPANSNNWIPKVETVSSVENEGMDKTWAMVEAFVRQTKTNGHFEQHRKEQQVYWMNENIKEEILHDFYADKAITKKLTELKNQLSDGKITSREAAKKILKIYKDGKKDI
jgi:LAO/AO transport system kinase